MTASGGPAKIALVLATGRLAGSERVRETRVTEKFSIGQAFEKRHQIGAFLIVETKAGQKAALERIGSSVTDVLARDGHPASGLVGREDVIQSLATSIVKVGPSPRTSSPGTG